MAAESKTADFEGAVLGMGNPLLDISAHVDMSLCEKYGVTMNNAILAEEKHLPLYAELVEKHDVEYIAGGATQNSMRVMQWVSGRPGLTTMIGCVGTDDFGSRLEAAAAADGVRTAHLKDADTPTGTCAVLVNKAERSLVANLSAANNYKVDHLLTDPIQAIVKKAHYYYMSGFFLTVSPDSMANVGQHAAESGKTFMMNLAAPFLPAVFKEQMHRILPFCDYVFGNESEAKAFAESNGFPDATIPEIALRIAALPKASGTRPRIVVITQGAEPTVVAQEGIITEYATEPLAPEEMVDLNGAGDAFVGGFVARLVEGESMAECVACGQWAARTIIRRSGCTFPEGPCSYKKE